MTCQAAEGMLAPSNWKNFGTRTTTSAASVSTSSTTSDRKSTRLNSSHSQISYAVFCLKKKKLPNLFPQPTAPNPPVYSCPPEHGNLSHSGSAASSLQNAFPAYRSTLKRPPTTPQLPAA